MEPEPYPHMLCIDAAGRFGVLTSGETYHKAPKDHRRRLERVYRSSFEEVVYGFWSMDGHLFDPSDPESSYLMVEALLSKLQEVFGVAFELAYDTSSDAQEEQVVPGLMTGTREVPAAQAPRAVAN